MVNDTTTEKKGGDRLRPLSLRQSVILFEILCRRNATRRAGMKRDETERPGSRARG